MIDIPLDLIAYALTLGLTFVSGYVGKKWKEAKEALKVTMDAIQDDKITRKELQEMIKEWKEVF